MPYPKWETGDGNGEIQVDIWAYSLGFKYLLSHCLL